MKIAKMSLPTFLATLGGLGYLTKAPGTLGSLAACVFYLLLPLPWPVIVAVALLGVWAADANVKETGVDDPGSTIIDEVVGMWLSLYALPLSFAIPAFFLFRVLDIVKPFPICAAEKLPGGLGIMADDVVGGVMCNLILQSINWIFWGEGWLRALFVS